MFHHHLEKLQDGWGLARWQGSEKTNINSIIFFRSTLSIIWMWMPAKMEVGYFKFVQGLELLTWMIWFALEHLTICGCEDRWKGGSLDCRGGRPSLRDWNRALHYLPNIVSSPISNLNPRCNSNKKPATGGESDSYYLQDCNLGAFYIAVYVYVTYIM